MVLSKKKPVNKEKNIIMILSMVPLLSLLKMVIIKLFIFIKTISAKFLTFNQNTNPSIILVKLLLFILVIVFLKHYHIFNKPKPSSFMKVFLMSLVVGKTILKTRSVSFVSLSNFLNHN
ncbi:MAG: hypothetical protein QS2022_1680 [Candidatus Phytoplasma asteris]|nr:MAG: hypothetical protein PLY_1660 [Periwinkle leaf yellowing phytoplasma]WEX19450.1 MAG: hypothetical protein QS2022_1680 [Candidatus Phytoplasma asteris]